MIRNLLILDKKGNNLLEVNFGECHSLAANPSIVSSFISAIIVTGLTWEVNGYPMSIRMTHTMCFCGYHRGNVGPGHASS